MCTRPLGCHPWKDPGQSYRICLVHTSYRGETACTYLIPRGNSLFIPHTARKYGKQPVHTSYQGKKSTTGRDIFLQTPCSYLIPRENSLFIPHTAGKQPVHTSYPGAAGMTALGPNILKLDSFSSLIEDLWAPTSSLGTYVNFYRVRKTEGYVAMLLASRRRFSMGYVCTCIE